MPNANVQYTPRVSIISAKIIVAFLLLNVPDWKGTGYAISPVTTTKSGCSFLIIVATAFIAHASFLCENAPPPIWTSVNCNTLKSRPSSFVNT